MASVRVGEVRRIVVAAPSYLPSTRVSTSPRSREAADHCMNHFGVDSWSFPPADGLTIPCAVPFTPRLADPRA
jgi:hypothetical protein